MYVNITITYVYIAVDCGALMNPDDGSVSFSTTIFTSIASYSCDTGYNLVGVDQRNCTSAVTWSDGEPTCQSEKQRIPDV